MAFPTSVPADSMGGLGLEPFLAGKPGHCVKRPQGQCSERRTFPGRPGWVLGAHPPGLVGGPRPWGPRQLGAHGGRETGSVNRITSWAQTSKSRGQGLCRRLHSTFVAACSQCQRATSVHRRRTDEQCGPRHSATPGHPDTRCNVDQPGDVQLSEICRSQWTELQDLAV